MSRWPRSFSDTELAENHIQQVLGSRLANDLADRIYGDSQVHRCQLQGLTSTQSIDRAKGGFSCAIERVLMPGIDHYLEHFSFDFTGPGEFLNGIFQLLNPLSGQTAQV